MNLYGGKGRSRQAVMRCYGNRLGSLQKLDNVDLIWLEKEAFPYVPYWIERLVFPKNIPVVADYDDAIFHNYDLSESTLLRWILGRKIEKIMAAASTVVCGNDYLGNHARQAGARHVEILPSVLDVTRYKTGLNKKRDIPVIGWIGSPSTQKYLLEIKNVLQRVCEIGPARLILVGAMPDILEVFSEIQVEVINWEEETEAGLVSGFDIGIMPLSDNPWERGKCGYKLLQYMACGLPSVASPVGVNCHIIENNVNGYLAKTEQEWETSLLKLIHSSDLRRQLGIAGRLKVETEYSLQSQTNRLINILYSAVDQA